MLSRDPLDLIGRPALGDKAAGGTARDCLDGDRDLLRHDRRIVRDVEMIAQQLQGVGAQLEFEGASVCPPPKWR